MSVCLKVNCVAAFVANRGVASNRQVGR
jgi:hypothetical protein